MLYVNLKNWEHINLIKKRKIDQPKIYFSCAFDKNAKDCTGKTSKTLVFGGFKSFTSKNIKYVQMYSPNKCEDCLTFKTKRGTKKDQGMNLFIGTLFFFFLI